MTDFNTAVAYVLANEGGLREKANDPGGITNRGISLRFLKSIPLDRLKSYGIIDETIDADTVRQLTLEQTNALYKGEFWNQSPFERIDNQELCNYIFDAAVNIGIAPAIKCAQRACWSVYEEKGLIDDDGILGEATLICINEYSNLLIAAMRSERAGYYRVIVAEKPNQADELDGWLNRAYKE